MKRQTVRVALEQPGTDDLIEFVVQPDNRDLVRWDLTRSRKGWPATADAPILWATVIAYFALLRAGEVGDNTVEQFIDRAVEVEFVKEDGEPLTPDEARAGDGVTDVDPSQPGHAPGS